MADSLKKCGNRLMVQWQLSIQKLLSFIYVQAYSYAPNFWQYFSKTLWSLSSMMRQWGSCERHACSAFYALYAVNRCILALLGTVCCLRGSVAQGSTRRSRLDCSFNYCGAPHVSASSCWDLEGFHFLELSSGYCFLCETHNTVCLVAVAWSWVVAAPGDPGVAWGSSRRQQTPTNWALSVLKLFYV